MTAAKSILSAVSISLLALPGLFGQLVNLRDIDPVQISPSSEEQVVQIDLSQYFDYEGLEGGTLVQLFSNVGALNLELLDQVAPNTVENFLFYVDQDRYRNSIIHRRSTIESSGLEVIQGGGFGLAVIDGNLDIVVIETEDPIQNEYNPDFPNVPYSISMAKLGGDPDSATSQWFINIGDNSEVLNQNNNGGFTVFANVIGASRATVDLIAGLQVVNGEAPLGELPVTNIGETGIVTLNDFVLILQADRLTKFGSETELGLISTLLAGNTNSNLITNTELVGPNLSLTIPANGVGVSELSLLVAEAGFESSLGELYTIDVRVQTQAQISTIPAGDDWSFSDWLGLTFFQPNSSWAFTQDLGWFFIVDSSEPEGQYFFFPGIGWVWTNENVYPYLWSFSANEGMGGWWTYALGSSNPRWFYDHTSSMWVNFDE